MEAIPEKFEIEVYQGNGFVTYEVVHHPTENLLHILQDGNPVGDIVPNEIYYDATHPLMNAQLFEGICNAIDAHYE